MCDPLSIAAVTFAVGAGQQVSQYVGEKQAYSANKTAANLNFANQHDILQQKHIQLDQQNSENALDTAIATVKAQGEVAASAASLGMSSSSIVGALNADMFGIGRQYSAEQTNDQNQRVQLANESRGAEIARNSQIAAVAKPNLLNLGLGIGGAALKGASAYSSAGGTF
jgi:N-acyl-D-aspartate/D-glutamate deacylase